jgi:signal transduction histidine kinase
LIGSGFVGLIFGLIAGRGFSRRLNRLTAASAAMASGDLEQRVGDQSPDEIGQLARQFNTMAAQLDENMRALRLLADQNAQLAEQAAQLAAVEERNRLARDLHDSVSQELFSLTMQAAAARRLVVTKPDQAAIHLGEIQATAQQALQETRSLIFALQPASSTGVAWVRPCAICKWRHVNAKG